MFTTRTNVAGASGLLILTCGHLLAQALSAEQCNQQIQKYSQVIHGWQRQEYLQIAFMIAVIVFGALIAAFQGMERNWTKPTTRLLSALIAILTGINGAHVFSADFRVLRQSVDSGNRLLDNMHYVVEALVDPTTDKAEVRDQWNIAIRAFTDLQTSTVKTASASASQFWPRPVYAQSAAPEWVIHPPSDTYNLYSAGSGEDRSVTVAQQQSIDNAQAGLARLAAANCDQVRKVIATFAVTDKYSLVFDKSTGVYRYYTLLRISKAINLHCP